MTFVSDLDPKPLWKHFDAILAIPRASKNEAAARQYVLDVAGRKGLEKRTDAAGNTVVKKPASPGKEGAPKVVLQSHLDMVTEKNSDITHDFSRDPIRPQRDGEWVKATGTTLGADNGIGAAAMLAVLEADDLVHGPLELLFTIDEETGLTGASELDPGMLTGKKLLNLDTEEEGEVTIGCAGAGMSELSLAFEAGPVPAGLDALAVAVSGLQGGHSGMEIHLPRGNAIKLLARALHAVALEHPVRLASVAGGGKHNAIPREAAATILVRAGDREAVTRIVDQEATAIRAELSPGEPDVRLQAGPAEVRQSAWTEAASHRVIDLLEALPHGVVAMSQDIPGLVETSTNLASLAQRNGHLAVLLSSRSSVDSALRALRRRIRATAELAGATVDEPHGYPGWKPDPHSPLLARFQDLHQRLTGKEAEVKAVHAGLECGIIGEKFPGMQMISFGPTIRGAHSPDERVHIPAVGRFWDLLKAMLAELAAEGAKA